MTLFICVGEQGSLLFNRRRVSSDAQIIIDILENLDSGKLYMTEYSAKLFPKDDKICVRSNYLQSAGESDSVFLEEPFLDSVMERADKVVVYHFNRLYPADVKFPIAELRNRGKLQSVAEFKGKSHERIKREVYLL